MAAQLPDDVRFDLAYSGGDAEDIGRAVQTMLKTCPECGVAVAVLGVWEENDNQLVRTDVNVGCKCTTAEIT